MITRDPLDTIPGEEPSSQEFPSESDTETDPIPSMVEAPVDEQGATDGSTQDLAEPTIAADERIPLIQALIVSYGDPLSVEQICETTHLSPDDVRTALHDLKVMLDAPKSGIELVEVGHRFQIRTKVAFSPYVRILKSERPRRLSAPALETLAIVAYRQPIVKSDVDKLRGVDSTPTLKTLLERGLVRVVGQAASVGHPSLYGTTDEFLKIFGLKALSDLPSLREASSLERDPGELEEGPQSGDIDLFDEGEETAGEPSASDDSSESEEQPSVDQSSAESFPVSLASLIEIEHTSPEEESRRIREHEAVWFLADDENEHESDNEANREDPHAGVQQHDNRGSSSDTDPEQ